MIEAFRTSLGSAVLLATVLGTTACTSLGGATDDWPAPRGRSSVLHGEVRSVDSRANQLHLRAERGRNQTVRYDNRTRVVYRQRTYPVSALERGDRVRVQVVHDRNGRAWAERVEVRESVRDRDRGDRRGDRRDDRAGRIERVDGTVSRVDTRRGSFALSPQRGRAVLVYLPNDVSRSDRNRFERLRRGDRVRADVRAVGRDQYELVRFR